MTRIVGIDLGTTNSLVAVSRPGGSPYALANSEQSNLTPSVVFFEASRELVGAVARRAAQRSPDDYVQFVKRQMGDPHWRFVDSYDREYRPEQISALILRQLVADASANLREPITDAVITVPAYFDDVRRKATRDAGEIAGLKVHRLINEPTAAAIAYGLERLATGRIFVFDLGGGTFDVTVMNASHGNFEVVATDGDRNLGGYDFDNALMLHVAENIRNQGGPDVLDDTVLEFDLREKCVQAKHDLSAVETASIYVTGTIRVDITRSDFERLTRALLDRTEVVAGGVLDDARLTWADIDHILLVGGSTRMPMVREMIERISGKRPVTGVDPDEAVALGAAIVAATVEAAERGERGPASYRDATSKSMGIVAVDPDRNFLRYNSIIIRQNQPIPVEQSELYSTVDHHQREVLLEVTEGNEEDLMHTTILTTQHLALPPGLPRDSPLKVTMSYSLDQMIFVEVIDLTNNRSLGKVELQHDNLLKRGEIAQMRESMAQRGTQ
jgi:molecular chaperone DnaK